MNSKGGERLVRPRQYLHDSAASLVEYRLRRAPVDFGELDPRKNPQGHQYLRTLFNEVAIAGIVADPAHSKRAYQEQVHPRADRMLKGVAFEVETTGTTSGGMDAFFKRYGESPDVVDMLRGMLAFNMARGWTNKGISAIPKDIARVSGRPHAEVMDELLPTINTGREYLRGKVVEEQARMKEFRAQRIAAAEAAGESKTGETPDEEVYRVAALGFGISPVRGKTARDLLTEMDTNMENQGFSKPRVLSVSHQYSRIPVEEIPVIS